jgi:hypothetical protein
MSVPTRTHPGRPKTASRTEYMIGFIPENSSKNIISEVLMYDIKGKSCKGLLLMFSD